MELVKRFIREEDGLGTVEMVIIVAVLVGVALIFREALFGFVDELVGKIFNSSGDMPDFRDNPIGKP